MSIIRLHYIGESKKILEKEITNSKCKWIVPITQRPGCNSKKLSLNVNSEIPVKEDRICVG